MMTRRTVLACAGAGLAAAAALPLAGLAASPAPEFAGLDGWLNAPTPLTVAGMRGKVVLVDFWTYSCINCRRTVPYLNRWQAEYGARGLQVVGIHTPEFGFEHARANVARNVEALGIRFPVGQDSEATTWRAWGNRAWPAFYLLDRDGRIVLVREGEGNAREIEGAIRALLALSARPAMAGDDPDLSRIGTEELYFGLQHGTPQDPAQPPGSGEVAYSFPPGRPVSGAYQLEGSWDRQREALVLRSGHGGMRIRFSAAKLHLVAEAPTASSVRVAVDGGTERTVKIGVPTLYTLLGGTAYGTHELVLRTDSPGLVLYSATFG